MHMLLNLLTMFGPFGAAKFWVAIAMTVVEFVRVYYGIDLGLDEATARAVVGGIGALLVWATPNKRKDIPVLTEAEARARTGYSGPIVDRSRR